MNTNFLSLAQVDVFVALAKESLNSSWQSEKWEVKCIQPPQVARDHDGWVYQPATLEIYQDELQGYFLNLETGQPVISCLLRYPDEDTSQMPLVTEITASYDEAARWMDSNEEVQTLPMPVEMASWLAELVQAKYKPEPKKRRRPQSFVSPEKRGTALTGGNS